MAESNFFIKVTPVVNDDLEEVYCYISEKIFAEDATAGLLSRIESNIMRVLYGKQKYEELL